MELFAVFREGVYRHECAGIFSTAEDAVFAAAGVIAMEGDSYHHYEVVPFVLDAVAGPDRYLADQRFIPAEAPPLYEIRRDKSGAISIKRIYQNSEVSE